MSRMAEEVQRLRREKQELEALLERATAQLSELSPRSARSPAARQRGRTSPSGRVPAARAPSPQVAPDAVPERLDVTGLSGFEGQTTGTYALSYFRDAPAPKQPSVVYEREPPNAPAFLVWEDGAWSIRSALDSSIAFLRALSSDAANPASLPATAWEMSCPGKSPHPWLPAPKSFTVTGYSDTDVGERDELREYTAQVRRTPCLPARFFPVDTWSLLPCCGRLAQGVASTSSTTMSGEGRFPTATAVGSTAGLPSRAQKAGGTTALRSAAASDGRQLWSAKRAWHAEARAAEQALYGGAAARLRGRARGWLTVPMGGTAA